MAGIAPLSPFSEPTAPLAPPEDPMRPAAAGAPGVPENAFAPGAEEEGDAVTLSPESRAAGTPAAGEEGAPDAGESQAAGGPQGADGEPLSEGEQQEVRELQRIDRRVHAHEQAHMAAGGGYTSGPSYEYTSGPDGRRYAVGGEVQIDTSDASSPAATIRKMQIVRAAALAPADPSGSDRAVAAAASRNEADARREVAEERAAEMAPAGDAAEAAPAPEGAPPPEPPALPEAAPQTRSDLPAEAAAEAAPEATPLLGESGEETEGTPPQEPAAAGTPEPTRPPSLAAQLVRAYGAPAGSGPPGSGARSILDALA